MKSKITMAVPWRYGPIQDTFCLIVLEISAIPPLAAIRGDTIRPDPKTRP